MDIVIITVITIIIDCWFHLFRPLFSNGRKI